MHQRQIQEVIAGRPIVSVTSDTTITDATKLMTERKIGALLIVDDGSVEGILSERDILNRVVAGGLDPTATAVNAVMTHPVITVSPTTKAVDALRMMQENGFRHLPVCEGATPMGMVSLRDFLGPELAEAQDEIDFEHVIEEELW